MFVKLRSINSTRTSTSQKSLRPLEGLSLTWILITFKQRSLRNVIDDEAVFPIKQPSALLDIIPAQDKEKIGLVHFDRSGSIPEIQKSIWKCQQKLVNMGPALGEDNATSAW